MLKPQEDIHRVLISTTSRLSGEFNSEELAIHHAWTGVFGNQPQPMLGLQESPISRNHFVVSFRTKPLDAAGQTAFGPWPDYSGVGDAVCAALALLFGKRFDGHGLFESTGKFLVPSLLDAKPSVFFSSGPNSHTPRPDVGIPLKLEEFAKIYPLFGTCCLDQRDHRIFLAAARFYAESLRRLEDNPDAAYLNLITCGEMLSSCYDYTDDELFDEDTKCLLQTIEEGLDDGDKIVHRLKGNMRQIKRRFVLTLAGPGLASVSSRFPCRAT